MPFLHLSKFVSPKAHQQIISAVTWLLRFLIGGVFIFSGFVKAIDPWGTVYKMTDYLGAMGLSMAPGIIVVGAFLLCAFEFILGIFIFCGCFRRGGTILGLLFMCAMLPLTLWIALFNPVDDCGCFGDAIKLSNWGTFWKNVALTAGILWLLKFNTRNKPLISPSLQWIAVIATLGYTGGIEFAGYLYQPLLDFRQYKTGTSIVAESYDTEEPEYLFTYKKGNIQKDFPVDSLPDESDGWEFVDRKEIKSVSHKDSERGIHVWDKGKDVTEAVFGNGDSDSSAIRRTILLLMPELDEVSIAETWRINSLYDWTEKHNIEMMAIVSGSDKDIETWKDLSMPEYPIYMADDTDIKELARGNPAVVYLEDSVIKWKSSLQAINVDDFLSPETSGDPMSFAFDSQKGLRNFSLLYLSIMVLLIMGSLAFHLKFIYNPLNRKNSELKDKKEK